MVVLCPRPTSSSHHCVPRPFILECCEVTLQNSNAILYDNVTEHYSTQAGLLSWMKPERCRGIALQCADN